MAPGHDDLLAGLGAAAGLCERCQFALLNQTKRGTVYLRCGLAAEDSRFARYPRLPVLECAGFRPIDVNGPSGPCDAGSGNLRGD